MCLLHFDCRNTTHHDDVIAQQAAVAAAAVATTTLHPRSRGMRHRDSPGTHIGAGKRQPHTPAKSPTQKLQHTPTPPGAARTHTSAPVTPASSSLLSSSATGTHKMRAASVSSSSTAQLVASSARDRHSADEAAKASKEAVIRKRRRYTCVSRCLVKFLPGKNLCFCFIFVLAMHFVVLCSLLLHLI